MPGRIAWLTLLCLLLAAPGADARRRGGGIGLLELHSMTEGATVRVDKQVVGTIPLRAPVRLPAGKHTLKITKRGYTEYLDVITIRRNKTTTLDIDLLPMAGILIVTASVEGAQVYVDGKFVGQAPLEAEVEMGERTVRVKKPGYYDFIRTIKSIAGQELALAVQLKAMPVGSTPYRPPPPPPPKWYEKWYVWAGIAGGVAAVATAIVVPVVLLSADKIEGFEPEYRWTASGLRVGP
jgi:hypothetical protein